MENQINKTNTMPPALEAIDLPASQKEELLVAYESIFLKKELQIPEDILGRANETIALIKSMEIPETEKTEIDEIINAIKIGIKGIEQSGNKEFTKRDAEYYQNKYLVKADLEAFAEDLARKTGKPQTVLDLSANNIQSLEIICTTGETVKGETYLRNAIKYLFENDNNKISYPDVLKKIKQIAGMEIQEFAERDADYYQNKYLVKADLEAFAEALSKETGEPQTILDLTTSNMRSLDIVCTTGELINGQKYLRNAAIALGLAKNNKEVSFFDTLKKLKQIAEIKERDADYYQNKDLVKADLEAFAEDLSKKTGEPQNILDLNSGNIQKLDIICTTGETVKGLTYLRNAAIALGLAKNKKEVVLPDILKKLKQIAEVKERDADYYQNKDLVKADLEAFAEDLAKKIGKPQTILDLTASNMRSLDIVCTNGETVKGPTYLMNAGIVLGLAKKNTEAVLPDILKKLKQIAGIEITEFALRDAEYYQNKDLVKADLEAFAEDLAKKTGKPKNILDLTVWEIKSLNIVCTTGETVKGPTYLYSARKYLFEDDNKISYVDVLKKLKQIAGIEIKEFAPRDMEYYLNKDWVKADLEAFAKALSEKTGKLQTILDLKAGNMNFLDIICTNDESVKGGKYLNNAAIALGLAKKNKEVKMPDILKKLKQIAGFSPEDLIDQELEQIASLSLEDAVSLLEKDPLKLRMYLQFAYPELLPEEIDKLVIRAIKAIYARDNFTKENNLLLTHTLNLDSPIITTDIPVKTDKNTITISGTSTNTDFVYFFGAYSKRTRVNTDGTFTIKIPLRQATSNEIRWMAVNTEKQTRSDQNIVAIEQTSTKDDTQALIQLLSLLGTEKLAEYANDENKAEFFIHCVEQMLIKKFTFNFAEGVKYINKLKKECDNPIIKNVLDQVIAKFVDIESKSINYLKGDNDLYFFQKYCYESIKNKVDNGDKGVILANEPGLGKTLVALAVARNEEESLIISPNNVVSGWTKEANEFFEDFNLLRLQNLSIVDRKKILKHSNHHHIVTNIEFLRKILNDEEIAELLAGDGAKLLVYDEAHSLINESQQTQGALKLDKKFFLLLTASPFKNISDVRRMLNYLYPDNFEYSSDVAFKKAFPQDDPEALRALNRLIQNHVIRFRKQDVMEEFDLNKPLAEQKGRLPHKENISPYEMGKFTMHDAQAEAVYEMFLDWNKWCNKYDKFIPQDQVVKLDGLRTGKKENGYTDEEMMEFNKNDEEDEDFNLANQILGNASNLSKKHAIRQIINNPEYIGLEGVENRKHAVIKELVNKNLAEGRKVVLFCKYNTQAQQYAQIFPELNPAVYTGITSKEKEKKRANGQKIFYKVDDNKNYLIDKTTGLPIEDTEATKPSNHSLPMQALEYEEIKFQNHADCKLMISTYSAGSVGKTFTAGKAMIEDDLPDNYIEQYQTEDRIHRIDNNYLTHYEVKYYQAMSTFSPEFLAKMKNIWLRKITNQYQLIEGNKGEKAQLIPYDENDEDTEIMGKIISFNKYEEVFDPFEAKKEELPSAYETFFANGTYDQVHLENLATQQVMFGLINDGIADESILEEGLKEVAGLK